MFLEEAVEIVLAGHVTSGADFFGVEVEVAAGAVRVIRTFLDVDGFAELAEVCRMNETRNALRPLTSVLADRASTAFLALRALTSVLTATVFTKRTLSLVLADFSTTTVTTTCTLSLVLTDLTSTTISTL
jgi:hypothetical protein